jgi:hypothetical protein
VGGGRGIGNRIGVALEHGHVMTITREQHGGAKAADTSAHDQNRHGERLSTWNQLAGRAMTRVRRFRQ